MGITSDGRYLRMSVQDLSGPCAEVRSYRVVGVQDDEVATLCDSRGRHDTPGGALVLLPDQPDPRVREVWFDGRGDGVRVAVVDNDQFPV